MANAGGTAWTLKGTVLISCNCDWGCPCNFNAPPTAGHCEGGWTWHIDHGTFGRCEECQGPIPKPRLQALPYTRHCVACARKLQQSS